RAPVPAGRPRAPALALPPPLPPGAPAGPPPPRRTGPPSRPGLREPRLYPLVDFRPDALDQALGDRVLVTGTEVGVRAHGSADLGLGVAAHERTLQRAG